MKPNDGKTVIGLTGTIASGKSTAARYLQKTYGFCHIDADLVGRSVSEDLRRELARAFGAQVLKDDGSLDRKALADVVFTDPDKLAQLNRMTHPLVCRRIRDMIASDTKHLLFLVEAIELMRSGLRDMVQQVWVVTAEPSVRETRLMRERGLTRQEAQERICSQLCDAVYLSQADVVLRTDDSDVSNLYRQCDEAVRALRAEEPT